MMETEAKRNSKDTVFSDVFRERENVYRLFRELHPEMTKITPEDIELVTLRPVLVNMLRNDLGFLVRERVNDTIRYKLLILVEAQSTWTLNILIRFLLYAATEYQTYISTYGLSLFGAKIIALPEPEFYVVYCGSPREDIKDVISLREDVFGNPDAKLDLVARVVHVPDESEILGEYILFCRVRDEQVAKYGLTMFAIAETIRICKDRNVLRRYLERREKEEIFNMVEAMFSEEYRQRVIEKDLREARTEGQRRGEEIGQRRGEEIGQRRGEEIGQRRGEEIGQRRGERIGSIRTFIEVCQSFGKSYIETADELGHRFNLSGDAVNAHMAEYWQTS